MGLRRDELHAPAKFQIVNQFPYPPFLSGAIGAAHPAYHQQSGVWPIQGSQAGYGYVNSFEWLYSAYKQQNRSFTYTGGLTGDSSGTWGEVGVIHARRNDLDPTRIGAVMLG
jgi:hypothetical protein